MNAGIMGKVCRITLIDKTKTCIKEFCGTPFLMGKFFFGILLSKHIINEIERQNVFLHIHLALQMANLSELSNTNYYDLFFDTKKISFFQNKNLGCIVLQIHHDIPLVSLDAQESSLLNSNPNNEFYTVVYNPIVAKDVPIRVYGKLCSLEEHKNSKVYYFGLEDNCEGIPIFDAYTNNFVGFSVGQIYAKKRKHSDVFLNVISKKKILKFILDICKK